MSGPGTRTASVLLSLSACLLVLVVIRHIGALRRLGSLGVETSSFGFPWLLLVPAALIAAGLFAMSRRADGAAMLSGSLALAISLLVLMVQGPFGGG